MRISDYDSGFYDHCFLIFPKRMAVGKLALLCVRTLRNGILNSKRLNSGEKRLELRHMNSEFLYLHLAALTSFLTMI